MEQYIKKSALVAEIKRRRRKNAKNKLNLVASLEDNYLLSFLDTLEVKDANEALRTEYEKGRADVIQATEQWLANSWPKYCENHNIIKAFKENVIED